MPISDSRARNRAFGLALDVQIPILVKMSQVISGMNVISGRAQLPFQKGKIISKYKIGYPYRYLIHICFY